MRVVVSGYGQIGKRLVNTIGEVAGVSLVGVVDKMAHVGVNGFELLTEKPDVIIDFSHPTVLPELLEYAKTYKVPCLIATTGFNEEEINMIKQASNQVPILFTYNTSLGINVMNKVLKELTRVLGDEFDIEIVERHHNQKIDHPSGTAKLLAGTIVEELDQGYILNGRQKSGKRGRNEVGIHAVRGGTIPGEHTVIFAGNDEILEIKHQALSKQIFVNGALKGAAFLLTQPFGLYNMEDVFKGE